MKEPLESIEYIKERIKAHYWIPPILFNSGITFCSLCGKEINLDEHEPHIFAITCGFICFNCSKLYEEEIAELMNL